MRFSFALVTALLAVAVAMMQQAEAIDFRSADPRASLGGVSCAVCTVVTGLVDQLAEVHRETHDKAFGRMCGIFPSPFSALCGGFRFFYGRKINQLLKSGETPDSTCMSVNMCPKPSAGQQMCHLFPSKLSAKSPEEIRSHIAALMADAPALAQNQPKAFGFCNVPLIGGLACQFLNVQAFSIQYPKDDRDKDGFSDKFSLRGSAWRGKDCKDSSVATYPGRKPASDDVSADSNCNGISGKGSAPYEKEFCAGSDAKGIIALGDSVTAHFHVPGEWFNATIVNANLYKNLSKLLENSFNWPHTSFYTGYQDLDSWAIVTGETDSLYLRLRERNLCNHRDYQNLGFNGGKITDGPEHALTVKRGLEDKPAIAIFSYIGNDVCDYNADPALDGTTSPAAAGQGLLDTMAVLNNKLPPGSHALVVGVADARPFFDSLRSKIHPFGAFRKDVTYLNFYEWLECLDINPCRGWLTADENVRAVTAQRVIAINNELERVVRDHQQQFPNVEMVFIPNPVDDVLVTWAAQGGESWQLVEEFDGFHVNQRGHKMVAGVLWDRLVRDHPNVIGAVNPKNDAIRARFGNQGGH